MESGGGGGGRLQRSTSIHPIDIRQPEVLLQQQSKPSQEYSLKLRVSQKFNKEKYEDLLLDLLLNMLEINPKSVQIRRAQMSPVSEGFE